MEHAGGICGSGLDIHSYRIAGLTGADACITTIPYLTVFLSMSMPMSLMLMPQWYQAAKVWN